MKILIVNGYPNTPKGNQDFQRYHELIQEIVRAQTDFVDTNLEFITRDRDDLDDYLYELDSPYVKKTAAKAFDYIDIVFMEGEATLLPWSPQASKMLILLRMCLRTKKILFASSFAMQALVYLAATNAEKSISIINGKGRGGNIADIIEWNGKLSQIKHDEYFLDNVTGDLYAYNYETSEWVPKMNVGIHYTKAIQASDTMGKFVKNTPTYKAKVFENNPMAYLSQNNEDFCYPKKTYLQHWAMVDIPSEFVVPAKNNWDIHKFNFVNVNKTFSVLAESKKCPQIIIFEPYCVASFFNITKKYAVTVNLLKNFVTSKLKELKSLSMNKKVISIEQKSEEYRSLANNFFNFSQDTNNLEAGRKVPTSRALSNLKSARSKDRMVEDKTNPERPKTAKLLHSGYALAHHDQANLIVENNTVRNNFTIKTSDDRPSTARIGLSSGRPNSTYRITKKAPVSPIDTNFDSVRINFAATQSYFPATAPHQAIALHNYLQKMHPGSHSDANSFSVPKESSNRPGSRSTRPEMMKNIEPPCPSKNRAEIARMLYPDLPATTVKEEEFWVPGQLSRTRPQTSTARKVTMESSFSSRFYSTYNKYKDMNPDDARAKPSIRTSGDYITEDEKKRMEEKENSKKNLGPAHITFGNKCLRPNFIPNYVTLTFSEPPSNHKFREVKKDKWVAGPMKLC